MGVTMPDSATPAAGWTLADYVTAEQTGTIAGDGTLTLAFDAVPTGQLWQVSRSVIACEGSAAPPPKVRLYVGTVADVGDLRRLRSGTSSGYFDEADYSGADGLLVEQADQLVAYFTGAPAGALASVHVQYRLLTQG